jgi:hypothetical protein
MLAILAAVLFALALLLALVPSVQLGVITSTVLMIADLLCVALHLAGIGTNMRRGWRR